MHGLADVGCLALVARIFLYMGWNNGEAMHWWGYLVAGYLVIGALGLIGGLFFVVVAGRAPGPSPVAVTFAALVAGQRKRIGRLRNLICNFLRAVPWIITWPVRRLFFRRTRSVKDLVSLRLRWPIEVVQTS